MDTGKVPKKFGAPGGYRNPPGAIWAFMGLSGKEKGAAQGGCATSPSPIPIRTPHGRGRATSWAAALSLPSGPLRPNTSPGGSGNPPGAPVLSETTPEPFRCPNIVVQYINLYVSTISRLLVMSVITSRTLNKLRYIKTYKLIIKLSS